jgi:hypothetical protein
LIASLTYDKNSFSLTSPSLLISKKSWIDLISFFVNSDLSSSKVYKTLSSSDNARELFLSTSIILNNSSPLILFYFITFINLKTDSSCGESLSLSVTFSVLH